MKKKIEKIVLLVVALPVCNHMHIVSVIKRTSLNWFLIYYSSSLYAGVYCKHISIEAVSMFLYLKCMLIPIAT